MSDLIVAPAAFETPAPPAPPAAARAAFSAGDRAGVGQRHDRSGVRRARAARAARKGFAERGGADAGGARAAADRSTIGQLGDCAGIRDSRAAPPPVRPRPPFPAMILPLFANDPIIAPDAFETPAPPLRSSKEAAPRPAAPPLIVPLLLSVVIAPAFETPTPPTPPTAREPPFPPFPPLIVPPAELMSDLIVAPWAFDTPSPPAPPGPPARLDPLPPVPPLIVPVARLVNDPIVAPRAFDTPAPPAPPCDTSRRRRPRRRSINPSLIRAAIVWRFDTPKPPAALTAPAAPIDRSAVRQFRDRVGEGVDAVRAAGDDSRARDRDRPAVAADRAGNRAGDDPVLPAELSLRRARRSGGEQRAREIGASPLNGQMLERSSTWRAPALRQPLFCMPMTLLLPIKACFYMELKRVFALQQDFVSYKKNSVHHRPCWRPSMSMFMTYSPRVDGPQQTLPETATPAGLLPFDRLACCRARRGAKFNAAFFWMPIF